jgi:hypothetical protein
MMIKSHWKEITLWFGVVLVLAFADWLEHIFRPYDIFSSFASSWLYFTLSVYVVGFLVATVPAGLIYGMIFKVVPTIPQSRRHGVKYVSALIGVFISAMTFPSVSSAIRNLILPEFNRRFSISGISVVLILLLFSSLWYIVHRFPWQWNLRPFRHSAFLLLLFVFTANGAYGYFSNIRLYHSVPAESSLYSVFDGEGHFRLAKVLRISTAEITLSIADSQFTVRPSTDNFRTLQPWFESDRSTRHTVTISLYNFLDWEPRLLTGAAVY